MIYLIVLLAALTYADIWLTRAILSAGGREMNPAMKWCMDRLGKLWFVPKVALTVFALAAFYCSGYLLAGLIFANVVYCGVVAWNLKEYRKC